MLLPRDDAEHFLKLHRALLCFTAEAMRGVSYHRPRSVKAFVEEHTPGQMATFRNHLASHPELIETFTLANPSGFNASDIEVVRSFRHAVHGPFYVMQHLQKHSIFLGGQPARVYGVLGLYDELEDVLDPNFLMVETTLLPFLGRIVYDGLIATHQVHFGPGIRRTLKAEASTARARYGVITSLPASAETPATPEAELRRYLRTEQSRVENAEEIAALVARDASLAEVYHGEMGKLSAARYKRRLREMGIRTGWFAVLHGLLVGGSRSRDQLRTEMQGIVPAAKHRFIHYFELKNRG